MNKNLSVVIVAAGASTRLNNKLPKPYIKINNKPVLWYSIYSFNKLQFVNEIYIVISENDQEYSKLFQKKYLNKISKFKKFIIGGKNRSDSVYNALNYIKNKKKPDFIAIHDAARPIITQDIIIELFNEAIKFDAAAPGIPIVDTIKGCDKNNFISSHFIRANLVSIQTPQVFEFNKLYNAYNKIYKKKSSFTDDTEIYSKLYKNIKIIRGNKYLFKITYNEDIKIAKILLKECKNQWN